MKVSLYKVGTKNKIDRVPRKVDFEKLLIVFFTVSFVLLVIIQAAMISGDVRAVISTSPETEGIPLEKEVSLFNTGTIRLKLVNSDYDKDIAILVNGAEAAVFKDNPVSIEVKDGDIIEIDGSAADYRAEIEVLSVSDNMDTSYIGKKTATDSNVSKLLRIKVE